MLRIATANLWCDEHHRDARVEAAAATLAPWTPDVVCLQEVVLGPGPSTAVRLGDALGLEVLAEAGFADGGEATGVAVLGRGGATATASLASAETPDKGTVGARLGAWAGA